MIQEYNNISAMYAEAAETIKTAILQGQYEALKGENRIQLAVYFSIGKYVSQNSRKGKWGTGALDSISKYLRKTLPGLRGFSAESLKKMRQFYEAWIMLDNGSCNSANTNSVIAITELEHEADSVIPITRSSISALSRSPISSTLIKSSAYSSLNIITAFLASLALRIVLVKLFGKDFWV